MSVLYVVGVKKKVKKRGKVICLPMPLNNFGHKMATPFRILSPCTYPKSLYINMGDTGLEPVTPCLSNEGTAFFTNFITA